MPSKPKFYHSNTFPVDAGNISFMDYSFVKEYGGSVSSTFISNDVVELGGAGRYRVNYKVLNTYNGDISGSVTLNINSGHLVVGDACYLFDKNWDTFLDDTDYLNDMGSSGYCVNTGGDGAFSTSLTISKIKSL